MFTTLHGIDILDGMEIRHGMEITHGMEMLDGNEMWDGTKVCNLFDKNTMSIPTIPTHCIEWAIFVNTNHQKYHA